jgi:hypothetical protein
MSQSARRRLVFVDPKRKALLQMKSFEGGLVSGTRSSKPTEENYHTVEATRKKKRGISGKRYLVVFNLST